MREVCWSPILFIVNSFNAKSEPSAPAIMEPQVERHILFIIRVGYYTSILRDPV